MLFDSLAHMLGVFSQGNYFHLRNLKGYNSKLRMCRLGLVALFGVHLGSTPSLRLSRYVYSSYYAIFDLAKITPLAPLITQTDFWQPRNFINSTKSAYQIKY